MGETIYPIQHSENYYLMLEAMRKYGGSFVQALADLIERADSENYSKLELAFPEYFSEYIKMSDYDALGKRFQHAK